MEKIEKSECYEVGYITKTHALKGEVSMFLDVDYPEEYEDMESFFVEMEDNLVPYEVEAVRMMANKPQTILVKIKGITSIEQAEILIGGKVFLPLDVLPDLDDTQFFFHEIVDFEIIDKQKGAVGVVETVYSFAQNDLLVFQYQGKEILMPINDETIIKVDRVNKKLIVDIPNGLLEVYLTEEKEKKEGRKKKDL